MNEFDKVGLYEHNVESYKKVREAFEENNIVGIVHATGTGKSYNALQLAYDNKDLKTVWVVPNNSIKEHILKTINDNPNLDMNRDFSNLEFRTYQSFINMSTDGINDLDVDLLVLDEFHHTGAPVWGSRINSIIDSHPDIKVFGMTAYTVRDRGTSYERDMALDEGDELFSNNIVSRYDLCDAIIDGVLPKPVYISSYIKLIDMTRELEERVQKLEASGRECSEYNKILNDVKKRIHEAPSLGEVVKQNIKRNGKYIYFCPPSSEEGTNDIETIKKEAMSWFKEIVPEEDIVIYTSLSEMEDSGKSNRDAFYDDLDLEGNKVDNKLRVMFAINQYNEGVHAPNLDGVIMGRGTCSDIVFFEQLGRALSVSSGVKEKIELYSTYSIERLRLICSQKNINYNYDMDKNELIEKLVAPAIIDLAGNIDFIRELEYNLKDRIKDYKEKGLGTLNRGFLSDASFDLDMYEVDLFNILMDLKQKTEMTWDDWYKLAEGYYKEHGNLDVTYSYVTKDGYPLGTWILRQRSAYKNRYLSKKERIGRLQPLSDEKVKLLEGIGMIWNYNEYEWNKMYELAQAYFKEHGNLNVPTMYVTKDGEGLRRWINTQRVAYKNRTIPKEERTNTVGILTDEQVKLLESIRMIWNPYKDQWKKMYELAQAYFKEHGDLNVSTMYVTKDGEGLGRWISKQRKSYKNRTIPKKERTNRAGKLTDEQVKLLENIGMIWDILDSQWEKMYELAQAYFKEHGDLNVPTMYVTKDGEGLGRWINTQRVAYKNRTIPKEERTNKVGILTDEQVKLLESIGITWNPLDSKWKKMYELAQAYFKEHGNLKTPQNFMTEDGEGLGSWISKQRKSYKNRTIPKEERTNKVGILTEEQVKLLENIGMIWDPYKDQWEKMFELAREYYEKYGALKVTDKYSSSNAEKLGNWIATQRRAYKIQNLTEEEIKRLESIGMIWDIKKNKSDIEDLCIENSIDANKNKDIIDHISFTEFKVKLAYLKDNGMNIVDESGKLHEIFSMSSMNMKLKYNVSLEDLVNMYNKGMNK